MGRPALIPQGNELVNILKQHPNLSYNAIHALYQWEGAPSSIRNAANKAGYQRQTRRPMNGGGRLDIGVMSDLDFWGQVDRTMVDIRLTKLARLQHERQGMNELRRGTTTTRQIGVAD